MPLCQGSQNRPGRGGDRGRGRPGGGGGPASTTTPPAGAAETEKFLAFHKELERLFPLVHRDLEKTVIDGNTASVWHSAPGFGPKTSSRHTCL